MVDENIIKKARKTTGLSQKDYAKKTGIPIDTIKAWESGRRKPSAGSKAFIEYITKGMK